MKYLYTLSLMTLLVVGSSFVADNETNLVTSTKIMRVYPNPATSYIIFEFDKSVDKTYSLQIFAFFGKKMTEQRLTDAKLNITLDDNYLRGLYIYQLRDQTGKIVESGKFQVNK
jgi:Secretion system C-terminal sorting domain